VAGAGLTRDEWLPHVPQLLEECVELWQLRLGDAYPAGAVAHAVRADLPDGTPAVLKLSKPDREVEQEADALERWDGDGAVRLLARDDDLHALLLERCVPGTSLAGAADALDVLIGLLPRLWKDGEGFHTLEDETVHWVDEIERNVRDPALKQAALQYIGELAPTQGEQVLVHQDLHGGNVLAAQREPWLVIDPKPLSGEREFALASIVRSFELGHSKRDVVHRLDRLTDEFGLDRERARGWTIVQTVAWSGGGDYYFAPHVEAVRWLLEDA
jgi:streptomycin 6-kinase